MRSFSTVTAGARRLSQLAVCAQRGYLRVTICCAAGRHTDNVVSSAPAGLDCSRQRKYFASSSQLPRAGSSPARGDNYELPAELAPRKRHGKRTSSRGGSIFSKCWHTFARCLRDGECGLAWTLHLSADRSFAISRWTGMHSLASPSCARNTLCCCVPKQQPRCCMREIKIVRCSRIKPQVV